MFITHTFYKVLLDIKLNLTIIVIATDRKGARAMPIKITLKAARVNAGLTLKEAAKKLGVCETTLVRWEKDPSVVQSKYHKIISEAYDYPSDYIIF